MRMGSARIWPLCGLLGLSRLAAADLAPPPPRESAQEQQARAAAIAKKLATCSPSVEENAGPRGTLITYRSVEYDLGAGAVTVTPPEARTPLRAWVNHFYKALRPCLPAGATLRSPERLPLKLSIVVASAHVTSVAALAADT